MDNKMLLESFKKMGEIIAREVQNKAPEMDNTALCAESDFVPTFAKAVEKMNMLDRKAGFVCKSTAGRVVRLIQPYDSTVYKGEPEEYLSMWGFAWSKDPAKAVEFIALATSPYNPGECCWFDGDIWRCVGVNVVHSPADYPDGWEVV